MTSAEQERGFTEQRLPSDFNADLFFTKLKGIIAAENQSLRLLRENLVRQYQVLLNQRLSDFLQVLEEQRALLWEMQQKEKIRQAQLEKYLPGLHQVRLEELIGSAPESLQPELKTLKSEFDHLVKEIEMMKNRNQYLIQKSLELIQNQLAILGLFEKSGYTSSGRLEERGYSTISRQV